LEPQIIPFDLARMLLGDAPPLMLLEIVVRTLAIYIYTLLLLRWVGGRSIAQLSIVEFLLVIALGSAVGDSLFYPEVPLLHAMLVVTLVVGLDKTIDSAIRRYRGVKRFVDGSPVAVIEDGHILCHGILARKIGTMELMELLRMNGIENLGQVRHAFMEASGRVSVFHANPPRPGLAIVPPLELAAPAPVGPGDTACCVNCGLVQEGTGACHHCGETARTVARTASA